MCYIRHFNFLPPEFIFEDMLTWKIRKVLASEHFELFRIFLFGIVLYSVDVGTDLAFIVKLMPIRSHAYKVHVISMIGLIVFLLPGVLMALKSVSNIRIYFYYNNNAWIKLTWKKSPLLLPYFLLMPIWGIFVPLIR